MKKSQEENQKISVKKETTYKEYTEQTRRDFLSKLGMAGLALTLPFAGFDKVFGSSKLQQSPKGSIPIKFPAFTKNKAGDGIIGPYGEVKIRKVDGYSVPVFISAAGGLALMDFTTNKWILKFGSSTDLNSITLTSSGIVYGKAKALPYTKLSILKFVDDIKKDKNKIKGAMLLRSSLATSYMVALQQFNGKQHPSLASTMTAMMSAMGNLGMDCKVETIFGPVTTLVPELQNVWKSAEEQFDECYTRKHGQAPCNASPFREGREACAWGLCVAEGFVRVLVDTIEVLVEVTQNVWHDVELCTMTTALNVAGSFPNPFDIVEGWLKFGVAQPLQQLSGVEIKKGIGLIKDIEKITGSIGGFLGPFAECALAGDWTIQQLNTPLNIGGKVTIPYGIKVCISSECAKKLSLGGMQDEAGEAWGVTLGILSILQPSLGLGTIATAFLSSTQIAAITSALAGGGEVAVIAATVILAWILIALYYATVISAQLEAKKQWSPEDFKDGKICIEHPTFAVAAVTLISGGHTPAYLIPPIVTG